jgi:hypothetical protein
MPADPTPTKEAEAYEVGKRLWELFYGGPFEPMAGAGPGMTAGTAAQKAGEIVNAFADARCVALRERIERLEKALPKMADGVVIVPGMRVWVPKYGTEDFDDAECLVTGVTNFNAAGCDGDGEESFHTAADDCHPDCDKSTSARLAYSTRAAALAASGDAAAAGDGAGENQNNE